MTNLALMAGISKGHLSNIENRGSSPSVQVIKKLACALEIPVGSIIPNYEDQLDLEWTDLIMQAKKIGINKEEIRAFFAYESWKIQLKKEV